MSRIRTNTIALGFSFFATAVLAFLQVKILTNYLDQISVGAWSSVLAVGALFGTLSELGLPQVLVRYGAKFDAEARLARLSRLVWFSIRVFAVAVVGVFLLVLLVGPKVGRVIGEEGAVGRWLLMLGYAAVASGTIRALNNASFRGLRRMVMVAVLEILFSILVTAGYFALRHRMTVEIALFVFLGASLSMAVVGLLVLHTWMAQIKREARAGSDDSPVFPEIRGFWQGTASAGILIVAIEQLDKPLIAALVGLQAVAVFHVASRLALFARRFLYVPFQVMSPEVTHKWAGSRRHELKEDMRLFIKLELALGLTLMILIGVFARPLLLLISTPEFLSGAPVLWVFIAVIPVLSLYQPLVMFLRAIGRVWYAFIGDILWLVTYLAVGSLLVESYGLPGFVSGQVVASVVAFSYILFIFHRLGLPRPELGYFLKRFFLSALLWGGSVYLGFRLSPLPWWQLGLLGLGLALAGNFIGVRGGYLGRDEEIRTLSMLAGKGWLGRLAGFFLGWPRGRMRMDVRP